MAGREGIVVAALARRSFRVGLAHDLFAAGEDGMAVAVALRWSSAATALRYARELAAGKSNAAHLVGMF